MPGRQLEKVQEAAKQVDALRDALDVAQAENATLRKAETASVQLKKRVVSLEPLELRVKVGRPFALSVVRAPLLLTATRTTRSARPGAGAAQGGAGCRPGQAAGGRGGINVAAVAGAHARGERADAGAGACRRPP
jgi:hypothetical protein